MLAPRAFRSHLASRAGSAATSIMRWHGPNPSSHSAARNDRVPVRPKPTPMTFMLPPSGGECRRAGGVAHALSIQGAYRVDAAQSEQFEQRLVIPFAGLLGQAGVGGGRLGDGK